nr:T9SS type A sorting domain-containing protein [Chitinophagales bacterium]
NIPGATSNTFVATVPGNYKCIVTTGLCTLTSNKIKLFLLVKEGDLIGKELQLFPNPAHDQFTIVFDQATSLENVEINITDITGRKIYSAVNQNTADESLFIQLPVNTVPGVYFVQVKADGINTTTSIVIE